MSLKIDGCIVAGSVVTIQLNRAADSRGERDYQARLFVAVPEMLEVIQQIATVTEPDYGSELSAKRSYWQLVGLRDAAQQLLAKIEGGGDE